MMKHAIIFFSYLFFAIPFLVYACSNEPTGVPPVRIVYFIPSGMEPVPDREERLGRVMRCVQDFFRKGMEQNGYGPMTFALEWNAPGKLKLYEVQGNRKQEAYGREDANIVRNEVREALKSQFGIDADKEYLVIFQLLLKNEGDRSIELGPYVGGGGSLSGTAWVYEDERLDAGLLTSKEPGGYYHGRCSLGKFNTHYIGGVAHEMGHAFSLPHVRERDSQRLQMGNTLMGSGNHTFGMELRNEGQGTFLSETSALRLSTVRAFAGNRSNAAERADWNIEELTAKNELDEKDCRTIVLSGHITASPNLLGIIAYNDNMDIPADYDAKAWITKDIRDGRFRIIIDELETAPYQLRLVGVHENGAISQLSVNYEVADEKIDLESLNTMVAEECLLRLYRNKKADDIRSIADNAVENDRLRQMAKHLVHLLSEPALVDVARLPANMKTADLTYAECITAETGWYGVHRGKVPDEVFLRIGGRFFESGLYAHAPSIYTIDLGGVWKTLSIGYGLQDGHDGSVRFIISGDGREMFRSEDVKDHHMRNLTFSIEKVRKLELIVESAQQGNSGAWGVWTDPEIRR